MHGKVCEERLFPKERRRQKVDNLKTFPLQGKLTHAVKRESWKLIFRAEAEEKTKNFFGRSKELKFNKIK